MQLQEFHNGRAGPRRINVAALMDSRYHRRLACGTGWALVASTGVGANTRASRCTPSTVQVMVVCARAAGAKAANIIKRNTILMSLLMLGP